MNTQPVKVGDQIEHMTSMATVLAILPYTGRYPQWFNCVLRLSSTQTRSGHVERAYDDPALRAAGVTAQCEVSQPKGTAMPTTESIALDKANTWELLTALCAKTDAQILEELGPCEGAFEVQAFVQKMRPGVVGT